MKVHKITFCIIDFDEVGLEQSVDFIENAKYPNHCIGPQAVSSESREIGEWSDDHPLNQGWDDEKRRPKWMNEFDRIFEDEQ